MDNAHLHMRSIPCNSIFVVDLTCYSTLPLARGKWTFRIQILTKRRNVPPRLHITIKLVTKTAIPFLSWRRCFLEPILLVFYILVTCRRGTNCVSTWTFSRGWYPWRKIGMSPVETTWLNLVCESTSWDAIVLAGRASAVFIPINCRRQAVFVCITSLPCKTSDKAHQRDLSTKRRLFESLVLVGAVPSSWSLQRTWSGWYSCISFLEFHQYPSWGVLMASDLFSAHVDKTLSYMCHCPLRPCGLVLYPEGHAPWVCKDG